MTKPSNRECTKCGEDKPLTIKYFYKNKQGKYGFESRCRDCANAYQRKYQKEWRKKNKDKVMVGQDHMKR